MCVCVVTFCPKANRPFPLSDFDDSYLVGRGILSTCALTPENFLCPQPPDLHGGETGPPKKTLFVYKTANSWPRAMRLVPLESSHLAIYDPTRSFWPPDLHGGETWPIQKEIFADKTANSWPRAKRLVPLCCSQWALRDSKLSFSATWSSLILLTSWPPRGRNLTHPKKGFSPIKQPILDLEL